MIFVLSERQFQHRGNWIKFWKKKSFCSTAKNSSEKLDMRFSWAKCWWKRKILIKKCDIVFLRIQYLRVICLKEYFIYALLRYVFFATHTTHTAGSQTQSCKSSWQRSSFNYYKYRWRSWFMPDVLRIQHSYKTTIDYCDAWILKCFPHG